MDNVWYSVYSQFHNIPRPDEMYIDDIDIYGIIFWYDGAKKLSEEIEKKSKSK